MAKNETPVDFEYADLIKVIDENLHQPDKFAKLFVEAAKSQKAIDEYIKDILIELIDHDKNLEGALLEKLKKHTTIQLMLLGSKIGIAIWSILLIIITALITKHFS